MGLQNTLDQLKAKIEQKLNKRQVEIMHNATESLMETGIETQILNRGSQMPTIRLENQNSEYIDFRDLLDKGPLVITFYRGIWCPYCNIDIKNLVDYAPKITATDASLVAITPEKTSYVREIHAKHKLNFDLFSDPGNQIAKQFGLRFTLQESLKRLYQDELQINLEDHNGDTSWSLPMPARFIINSAGIIEYAEASADYTKRPDPDVLIKVLSEIGR